MAINVNRDKDTPTNDIMPTTFEDTLGCGATVVVTVEKNEHKQNKKKEKDVKKMGILPPYTWSSAWNFGKAYIITSLTW